MRAASAATPTPAGAARRPDRPGRYRLHRLQRRELSQPHRAVRPSGVPTRPSGMSFGVSLDDGALEYAGGRPRGLFGQRRNLLRPRFWRCSATSCASIARRRATVARPARGPDARRLSDAPATARPSATIICCRWRRRSGRPPRRMRDHPARAFVRFFAITACCSSADRPPWRTVAGGSRDLRRAPDRRLSPTIRLKPRRRRSVRRGRRRRGRRRDGARQRFDDVVIAAHADQALALLDDPSPTERELLGAFRYSRNRAVLHRDPSLMPSAAPSGRAGTTSRDGRRRCRAASASPTG